MDEDTIAWVEDILPADTVAADTIYDEITPTLPLGNKDLKSNNVPAVNTNKNYTKKNRNDVPTPVPTPMHNQSMQKDKPDDIEEIIMVKKREE